MKEQPKVSGDMKKEERFFYLLVRRHASNFIIFQIKWNKRRRKRSPWRQGKGEKGRLPEKCLLQRNSPLKSPLGTRLAWKVEKWPFPFKISRLKSCDSKLNMFPQLYSTSTNLTDRTHFVNFTSGIMRLDGKCFSHFCHDANLEKVILTLKIQ